MARQAAVARPCFQALVFMQQPRFSRKRIGLRQRKTAKINNTPSSQISPIHISGIRAFGSKSRIAAFSKTCGLPEKAWNTPFTQYGKAAQPIASEHRVALAFDTRFLTMLTSII